MKVDATPVEIDVDVGEPASVRIEESLLSFGAVTGAGVEDRGNSSSLRNGRRMAGEMRSVADSQSAIGPPGSSASCLLGVLARPQHRPRQPVAVVIVVGGPQTRVGSHRQFVLLARRLAAAGFVCLRFDYTGMGDSPGPKPDFEAAGTDLRLACDAVLAAEPECRSVALWGLCDGATAAVFHAVRDERVTTVIAANPWARSDATRSATMVHEHYGSRLRSPVFWKKVFTGRVDVITAAREFTGHLWRARGARKVQRTQGPAKSGQAEIAAQDDKLDLPARLAAGLSRLVSFSGVPPATQAYSRLHLQLSGNDLTASEFELAMETAGVLEQVSGSVLRLPVADHTFSDPAALEAVIVDVIAVLQQRGE